MSNDRGQYTDSRQDADIDVLQLSFLTVINGPGGAPEVNFANAGDNCTTFSGTSLLNCPQIGYVVITTHIAPGDAKCLRSADIKTCQAAGKTILLSIGGATYSEGGFTSSDAATAGALLVWDTFGPKSNSSIPRPFGDAVVDGFDFDFESTVSNMDIFGNKIRSLMDADTSKKYYLTAAPQCPYPDAADSPMLNGVVSFDAIWVQFYNNFCGINSYVAGSTTQNNFNFETWDSWAKNTSKNSKVKVFLGVPANTGAAGTGYLSPSLLAPVIQYSKTFSSFGGVMMWDASQAYANNGFISSVASTLLGTASRIMRRLVTRDYI
jgi:chitinase